MGFLKKKKYEKSTNIFTHAWADTHCEVNWGVVKRWFVAFYNTFWASFRCLLRCTHNDKVAFYKQKKHQTRNEEHEAKHDSCVTRVWRNRIRNGSVAFMALSVQQHHIYNDDLMCCGRSELLPHSSFIYASPLNRKTKWNILATSQENMR